MNWGIILELIQKWNDAEHLDLRFGIDGKTALHLAVEAGNEEAVWLLLSKQVQCLCY